jgi:hypothetical protein
MSLPKTISTTRTFTYDVAGVVQMFVDMDSELSHEDVTLEQVLDVVLDWAYEDLRSPIEKDPTLVDEDGNALN